MFILYYGNNYYRDFCFYHPDFYRWECVNGEVIFTSKRTGEIVKKTKVVTITLT